MILHRGTKFDIRTDIYGRICGNLLYASDSNRNLLSSKDLRINNCHIKTASHNQKEYLLITNKNGKTIESLPAIRSSLYITKIRSDMSALATAKVRSHIENHVTTRIVNRVADRSTNRVADQAADRVADMVEDHVANKVASKVAGQVADKVTIGDVVRRDIDNDANKVGMEKVVNKVSIWHDRMAMYLLQDLQIATLMSRFSQR